VISFQDAYFLDVAHGGKGGTKGAGRTDEHITTMQHIVRDCCRDAAGVPYSARAGHFYFGMAAPVIDLKTLQISAAVERALMDKAVSVAAQHILIAPPRQRRNGVDTSRVRVVQLYASDGACASTVRDWDAAATCHVVTVATKEGADAFQKSLVAKTGVFSRGVLLASVGARVDRGIFLPPRSLKHGVSVHSVDSLMELPAMCQYFRQWGEFIFKNVQSRYPVCQSATGPKALAVKRLAGKSWLALQAIVAPDRHALWQ
jgi:hypothetical protein